MKEKQRKKKTGESGKLPRRLSAAGFAGVVLLASAICGCRAGTTRQALYDYYDEDGRLIYESAYITHGSLDYFFIYTDGSCRPAYCLQLDNNLGYCIPLMVELEY